MSHWFDRLSTRASDNEPITRREALKGAAVGAAAVGALASPALASAGDAVLRRENACKCQDGARDRFNNNMDGVDAILGTDNDFNLILPPIAAIYILAGSGALLGMWGSQLACGKCRRSPSGGGKPAPPAFTPCAPRGGLRRGPQCPGGGGGDNNDCPPNTTRCTLDLCCYGTDFCCRCKTGNVICCIADANCACC